MSKRVEEQLRRKEELRKARQEAESVGHTGAQADPSPTRVEPEAMPAESPTVTPSPALPAVGGQSVGDMRTAGAATRRITESWEKGLAAKLEEKTAEAAALAAMVEDLKKLGVEWKIVPVAPALVDVVGFNRFASTFDPKQDRAFADLLANIEAVGGNKQPGMVRPSPSQDGRYELVFGERRLRACEQAGLPFTAIVASISDEDVWLFREAENFGRKDKGILEQALGFVDMPARFAYGERDGILEKLKISKSHFHRLKQIATVPKAIWETLPLAHTTTAREAQMVVDAYREDPRAVKLRCAKVRQDMSRAEAVRLIATGGQNSSGEGSAKSPSVVINRSGSALSLKLVAGSDESASELESELRRWLEERGLREATTH